MANISIKDYCKTWWNEVYNRIIGAAVFIDDSSAECLHWDGGLFNLLDGGAVSVKPLSPFEAALPSHRKGVFITSTTRNDLDSIKEIIRNSNFTHCILISTTALDIVYGEINEERDLTELISSGHIQSVAQNELQDKLISWLDKKQYSVEVIHIPIFTISPTSNVFITPSYRNLYPQFKSQLTTDLKASLDLYSLSKEVRAMVRRLASNLNSLFYSLNIKEDIYYMGMFSSILAGVLENSPICTARKKKCNIPASLIIVDRTLDICGVCSHSSESLLDRIMTALPRFSGHTMDVAVDMSTLCEANVVNPVDDIQLCPGCIYHANDDTAVQTFDYLLNKTQSEVMFHLYNKLTNLDVNKSPASKNIIKVTPQTIEKIISPLKGNYKIIENNLGILQQSIATVQALKSSKLEQADLISSLEKQAFQSISTSRDSTSILNQVCQLIKNRYQRGLSLERLLSLLVHIYSLAGDDVTFSSAHEGNLLETLKKALFEDRDRLSMEGFLEETFESENHASDVAKNIIEKLREVGQARRLLNRYKSVLKTTETGHGFEYKSVLQQLVEDLVDSERPEILDLKHRSEGIKDLLRSGIGMLMSSATKKSRSTKHPMDNQTVIIYVIGGMNAEEVRKLHRSVITSGCDAQVIFATNKFVNPIEAMKDILFT